ncbi:MAG: hypothetical protein HC945_00320 [Nitrosarchaeum sp.]|nr:hypothetical protein [Nitrosarchaeum sp.]
MTDQSKWFYCWGGRIAREPKDLIPILKDMSGEEFRHHVRPEGNDFANWVREVFDEDELADQMEYLKDVQDTLRILQRRYGGPEEDAGQGSKSSAPAPEESAQGSAGGFDDDLHVPSMLGSEDEDSVPVHGSGLREEVASAFEQQGGLRVPQGPVQQRSKSVSDGSLQEGVRVSGSSASPMNGSGQDSFPGGVKGVPAPSRGERVIDDWLQEAPGVAGLSPERSAGRGKQVEAPAPWNVPQGTRRDSVQDDPSPPARMERTAGGESVRQEKGRKSAADAHATDEWFGSQMTAEEGGRGPEPRLGVAAKRGDQQLGV